MCDFEAGGGVSSGFGVLGRELGGLAGRWWKRQLFHVEQLEMASKDGRFDGFWTVPGTVSHGGFYGHTDGDLR